MSFKLTILSQDSQDLLTRLARSDTADEYLDKFNKTMRRAGIPYYPVEPRPESAYNAASDARIVLAREVLSLSNIEY